ncbi:MAG: hypothetical protein BGO65_14380 [Afipia sp. 64-13]|nr:MAG: hypothetical protein BGO65_14380 [Afipia sp. 64-13]
MRPLLHCDERHRALTTVPRRSARSWSASRNRYRLLAVLTLTALGSFADRAFAQPPAVPATSAAPARPVTAQQMADYRRRLTEYTAARESFEHEAGAYWSAISEKRRTRNTRRRNNEPVNADHYVMIQPPLYRGPSKPADPSAPTPEKRPSRPIPVIRDFLQHASEQFQFTPQRPKSEIEFKRAYAAVAKSAGLTKDQAVRVYGFESGGNGAYDIQAGLEQARPNARAISTALGYNQLLVANTVELLAEQGTHIIEQLKRRADTLPESQRARLMHKIATVHRMVTFCKSVPDTWSAHVKLAQTPKGMGVHALNLDVDVGPWLQTHKLLTSVVFARRKGYTAPLTAAELEMMNLTGDGTGFDMVSMPHALRAQVPTANFFQREGYERNPVAIRNNVVAKLLAATDARMDRESTLPGARDLAAAF